MKLDTSHFWERLEGRRVDIYTSGGCIDCHIEAIHDGFLWLTDVKKFDWGFAQTVELRDLYLSVRVIDSILERAS